MVTPGDGDETARAPAERSIGFGLEEHHEGKAVRR